MQFFFYLGFLVVVLLAIFAVQNSSAPMVTMKFLFWQFETSSVYTILGSIGSGMVIILLLWIPSAIRASLRTKNLKKERIGAYAFWNNLIYGGVAVYRSTKRGIAQPLGVGTKTNTVFICFEI